MGGRVIDGCGGGLRTGRVFICMGSRGAGRGVGPSVWLGAAGDRDLQCCGAGAALMGGRHCSLWGLRLSDAGQAQVLLLLG